MKRILRNAIVLGAMTLSAAALPAYSASAEETDGWQAINGRRYYIQNGEAVTGEVEIDGVLYLFAPNGALQTGWQTVDGKRFYYDKNGTAVFGWVTWRGEEYYVSPESGKCTGWQNVEGKDTAVSFDDFGVKLYGWTQRPDQAWVYQGESGEILEDGIPYLLDENGVLLGGFQTPSDGVTRFYDAETREIKTGWITVEGVQYYADPECGVLRGLFEIDGKTYLFDDDGIMQTGFAELEDGTRYFDSDGVMLCGMQELDKKTYLFNENGIMLTGLQTENGNTRYFDENGVMQIGWITLSDGMRYFDSNGVMLCGLQELDKKTYLFNENGIMLTGLQTENGNIRYFDKNGVMQTGWITVNSKKYYADNAGKLLTGWQEIENYGYFFHNDGSMAVSTTVDGFTIDAQGHARSDLAVQVDTLLDKTKRTPASIYTYLTTNYRYYKVEKTRTYEQLKSSGWDSLVKYTLKNRRGVCYYLAATMDYFLQRAGYTTRMVHATHNTGNHYWNQVLVDGKWQNYDPTYKDRGNITWSKQISLGNYIVLGYVEAKYDARGAYLGDVYTPYSN